MTSRREDYTVGWLCAIQSEYVVACALLDEIYSNIPQVPIGDNNSYTFGRIRKHNVVISCLPMGRYGTNSTAVVAERMRSTFPALRFGLLVGIAAGAPGKHDIRLGDIVVSVPTKTTGGVIQYDFGKALKNNEFEEIGQLNSPPEILLNAVHKLAANHEREGHNIQETMEEMFSRNERLRPKYSRPKEPDRLYQSTYNHSETCACQSSQENDPNQVKRSPRDDELHIHYGLVASANKVMKDAVPRDSLLQKHGDILCFEMEAAGLMNNFPCLVIRGICDYADSHKNESWQGYAATTAAAYAKELLVAIPEAEINRISLMILPYPRDKQFVGREEELQRLEADFNDKGSTHQLRNALVGMGGVGYPKANRSSF